MFDLFSIVLLAAIIITALILAVRKKLDYVMTGLMWIVALVLLFITATLQALTGVLKYGEHELPDMVPDMYLEAECGYVVLLIILSVLFIIKLVRHKD